MNCWGHFGWILFNNWMNFARELDGWLHKFGWNWAHNNKMDENDSLGGCKISRIIYWMHNLLKKKKKIPKYCCTLTILEQNQKRKLLYIGSTCLQWRNYLLNNLFGIFPLVTLMLLSSSGHKFNSTTSECIDDGHLAAQLFARPIRINLHRQVDKIRITINIWRDNCNKCKSNIKWRAEARIIGINWSCAWIQIYVQMTLELGCMHCL